MGLTSDQQKRCDEIVEQALALDVTLRAAFVTEASHGDEDIRREADAILEVDLHGQSIFDVSPGAFLPPPNFGRYQTEELIGSGGMSVVYRALDPIIDRKVAVKVMAQRLRAPAGEYQRFLSELHLLGSLGHPNIVQVFDAGNHEGLPFIVMEYLEGENLAEAIQHGRCGDHESRLFIARQLAEALQRVHAAAVCHRDVKPANVFLQSGNRVKLMDFGVSARLNGPRFTQSGALIGTLAYLAPEQIRGEKVGPATDIYAFGILLFELFTGSKPFSGSPAELLYNIVNTSIPLGPLAGVPPALFDLICRATAKTPADRPRSFDEILQVLNIAPAPVASQRSVRNKRLPFALAAAVIIAVIGTGWVWISSPIRNAGKPSPAFVASQPTAVKSPASETPAPQETVHKAAPQVDPPVKEKSIPLPPKHEEKSPPFGEQRATLETPAPQPVLQTRTSVPDGPHPADAPREQTPIVNASPPPAPVVILPPDASGSKGIRTDSLDPAKRSDSLIKKSETPDEKLPSPAPSVPAANVQRAAEAQKIREVIERYANAYRMMRIDEIKEISDFSAAFQRSVRTTFDSLKIEDYRLEPQSDPRIDGDSASVRCKRSVLQSSNDRSALQKRPQAPMAKTSTVMVELARKNGSWKIVGIKEEPSQ